MIKLFKRVCVVVDALDEYLADTRRDQLSKVLFQIQKDAKLNLIATSRHIPEIKAAFEDQPSLEISAAPEDLAKYMKESMHRFPDTIQQDEEFHLEITAQLINTCQGM